MKNSKIVKNRAISQNTIKKLYGLSGSMCSICGKDTILQDKDDFSVISNIAHIDSFSKDGPKRIDGTSIQKDNSYDNLILLCPSCHASIDKKGFVKIYTIKKIKELLILKKLSH
jgi:hypothetical protein